MLGRVRRLTRRRALLIDEPRCILPLAPLMLPLVPSWLAMVRADSLALQHRMILVLYRAQYLAALLLPEFCSEHPHAVASCRVAIRNQAPIPFLDSCDALCSF